MKDFVPEDATTWKLILNQHDKVRRLQIHDLFNNGLEELPISAEELPNLKKINEVLNKKTGFQGIYVDGLEGPESFYSLLAEKKFPIGHFVRNKDDLGYTPEPDLVHDLYGHIPFFMDSKYAHFCQEFGRRAEKFFSDPEKLRQIERFFWFTIEFALIKTPKGLRVFGAGIASSIGECEYALSNKPQHLPFDVDRIRGQEFRIDQMQPLIFVLENEDQLYSSLDTFYSRLQSA